MFDWFAVILQFPEHELFITQTPTLGKEFWTIM